jgi:peptidoglycan/LPS O-acetylase OafA/YrhL
LSDQGPNELSSAPQRIPELDGLRGLAVILVLLYHYVAVSIPADSTGGLHVIRQLFSKNWSGVDLFFVLSGFLIGGILIDNRSATNYFSVFYTRRISRIFPLYYFFLGIFLLMAHFAQRPGLFSASIFVNRLPTLPYFLYVQNFIMALRGTFGNEFLAVTWSLAIEEHFYLLLPMIVWVSRPKRLPLNLLFLISLSLILRTTLARGTFSAFVLTPWRLDSLFLGVLLAMLIRAPVLLTQVKARLSWIKLACGALFLYLVYCALTQPLGSLNNILLFGVFYATLIFLTLAEKTGVLARIFRRGWLMNIGRVSYALYLFHQMVNGLVHDLLFKTLPRFENLPTILATLLSLLLLYLLANGTYYAFEKRFIARGHRRAYSRG